MKPNDLKDIGLLESEGKVYLALLRTGQNSAGSLARETKLNRVSAYKVLQSLLDKGLVNYVIKANRREYHACSPKEIERLIQKKKSDIMKLERSMPDLQGLFNETKSKIGTNVYEGVKGAIAIWSNLLGECMEGDEWLAVGEPKSAEIMGGFFKSFNKKLSSKGGKLKIIYNQDAAKLINARKKQPSVEIRVMPSGYITPASLEVVRDNALLVIYDPQIIIIHIKSPEVAKSFKAYFKMLWLTAKPVK